MTEPVLSTEPSDDISKLALLGEPTRRRVYEYVAAAPAAVGRDEVAAALSIGRPLAAFHLDRLLEAGVLESEYRRLGGRTGPGAGRPAKLYRRAGGTLAVSMPPREYGLASEIFAEALEDPATGSPPARLTEIAVGNGARAGGAAAAGLGADADAGTREAAWFSGLAAIGYEPVPAGEGVILRNCPFDALAQSHRELMCPTNLAFLEGYQAGFASEPGAADPGTLVPHLTRPFGACCVTFGRARATAREAGASPEADEVSSPR